MPISEAAKDVKCDRPISDDMAEAAMTALHCPEVPELQEMTLRELARKSIGGTRFLPAQGRNRIGGMVEQRPDWVISRQRAWGVPITVFVHKETGEVIPNAKFKGSKKLQKRIVEAFKAEGADAWFADGAAERFLAGVVEKPADWEQVRDILDVWFELGLHARLLP